MKNFIFVGLIALLTSCASIVDGSNQTISVTTSPDNGATCQLQNNNGVYFINQTPGTVQIKQSTSDMVILCQKGNKSGVAVSSSSTKGMEFGNILAGGIIGAAVDMQTGAAYKYPSLVTVQLKSNKQEKTLDELFEETKKKADAAKAKAKSDASPDAKPETEAYKKKIVILQN